MLGGQFGLTALNASIFTPATTVLTEGLNFGEETVGTARAPAPMRITNTGPNLLLVRGLKITGDFAIASDGCSTVPVLPGAVCTLGVSFTPTDAGPRAGTVTFRANTTTSPHSAALSGTGIAAVPTATPAPDPTVTPMETATPLPAPVPTPMAAPPLPKPQLQATLSFTFKASRTSTKLNSLTLRNLQRGVTVTVVCPKGCKQKRYTVTAAKSTVSLKLLVPKALKVGTKLTLTIRKPGALGLTKTLTIRRNRAPSVVTKLGVD
jgi:hypothetical protein